MKQHLRLRRLLEVLSLLLLVVRSRSTTSVDAFAFSSHVSTTSSASSSAMIVATTKRRLHHHFIYHSTHSRTPMGGISSSSSRRTMTMLYNNMSSNENDDGNNNMVNKSNNDDNSDTNNNGIDEELLQDDDAADSESFSSSTTTSTSLSRQDSGSSNDNTNNIEQPKKVNPYLDAIATPPPSDLISQFANTASSRAKNAARATIAGLMGGLTSNMMNGGVGQKGGYEDGFGAVGNGGASSDAAAGGVMDAREKNANNVGFTSKIVATGARLANLMFQLQMTGYMLRNAEYRLELGRSLGPPSSSSEKISRMLPSQLSKVNDEERLRTRRGRIVKGTKIKVRYGDADAITGEEEDVSNDDGEEESILSSPFMGLEVEVDAKAYVSELRGEIKRLRDAIESTRRAKEEEVQEDLLMYIRSLPPQELQQLTGTMSPEVLEAMKGLVSAVLAGIGEEEEDNADDGREFAGRREMAIGAPSAVGEGIDEGEDQRGDGRKGSGIGPNTVTEQSGEALARLCMWQLVVGYNLREMEVREKLRASIEGSSTTTVGDDNVSEGDELFGVLE